MAFMIRSQLRSSAMPISCAKRRLRLRFEEEEDDAWKLFMALWMEVGLWVARRISVLVSIFLGMGIGKGGWEEVLVLGF